MCSTRTFKGKEFSNEAFVSDAVLNADDIARWSPQVGPHLTLVRIPDGMHDLVLSAEPVRNTVFDELDRWISTYLTQGRLAATEI
jgi:alpha-beta hydrolase superfamily lysophospholipase